MPSQDSSIVVSAPAEVVWAALRKFDSFAWSAQDPSKPHMPTVITNGKAADAVGAIRDISLGGGASVVETLLALSDRFDTSEGAFYTYTINLAPFAVANYIATLSVNKVSLQPDQCFVRWTARWEVPAGTDAAGVESVKKQIAGLFNGSLTQLAKNFSK